MGEVPQSLQRLLQQIEARTVQCIAAGRDVTTVGPFLAALHPTSDLVWLNFAVPRSDWTGEFRRSHLDALRDLFQSHGRRLRFEYFESLWPDLGPWLERCGLTLEGRMPLMLCSPGDFRPFAASGLTVRDLPASADDALISTFLATAKQGFGIEPATIEPGEIAEQRQHLQTGVYRCAYAEIQGRVVGVGSVALVNDELAGIATLAGFRRRGVAASVSSHLVARHFEAGRPYVWLSAGDDAARALYEKIGFRAAGVQLNYVNGS